MLLTVAVSVTLAVATIAGLPTTANGQEGGDSNTIDVRIAAQRRLSGKIEFALQQREYDGHWGTRLLPDQRFFPTATRVGTWLVSTPLSLESASNDAGDDAAAGDFVARIVARRLAGGRVEFALQQQLVGGGWGERLLPDRQYFPVDAAVGRWLVSSPLTLTAGEQSATGGGLPPPIDPTDATTVPDSTTTNTGVSPVDRSPIIGTVEKATVTHSNHPPPEVFDGCFGWGGCESTWGMGDLQGVFTFAWKNPMDSVAGLDDRPLWEIYEKRTGSDSWRLVKSFRPSPQSSQTRNAWWGYSKDRLELDGQVKITVSEYSRYRYGRLGILGIQRVRLRFVDVLPELNSRTRR